MCESRPVPSGQVYRQLFDAQVQLSRSLLAGRKDTRTECLSAEDSNTNCSTTSSRRQQVVIRDDDVIDDVIRLPDIVVYDHPRSDIIERLMKKKRKKHEDAVTQLNLALKHLSQGCETQVRTIGQQSLSSLQDVDHRLDSLKVRMEHQDHASLQEVFGLWEEVEDEVKLKKIRISELKGKLSECERRRAEEIRAALRSQCHLLEEIGFLSLPEIHRLIHTEATMLNQSLLANRRSIASLLFRLQADTLQQEALLHQHWEDCLSHWKRSKVSQVTEQFRNFCTSDMDDDPDSVQQMKQIQQDLTEKRTDVIHEMSSLVPPTCSTALVSDWFDRLTAVNQQIDHLHGDLIHQLRCRCERTWQNRLAEVEHCKEALSALHLSEKGVAEVIASQVSPLIEQRQSEDEQRLAAMDVCYDSASRLNLSFSRRVYSVMRAVALLWEMHCRRLERREEKLQGCLDDLRCSSHQKRVTEVVDGLLGALRQEGSEDDLKKTLNKTVKLLPEVQLRYKQCISDQLDVLDCLPTLFMEELVSYSNSLCSFFQLSPAYRPSPEEVQKLHPSLTFTGSLDHITSGGTETPERPVTGQDDSDSALDSQEWLTEVESSTPEVYDIDSCVTFTSSRGVVYSGPAFGCPDLPDNRQQEIQLNLFPVEVLIQTLSRTRILFVEHLEQCFHDALGSAVAMATKRKEALLSEQELHLQHLNPQHIHTTIYQPRLAELLLHSQHVDDHCEEISDVLTSCKAELQALQSSINRQNQDFTNTLSRMRAEVQMANSSQCLQAVISTLQDLADDHVKQIQHHQTSFRHAVQIRLQEARTRTAELSASFRLFSVGGDFAPGEVKMFQKRLKEETQQLDLNEDSIFSELEALESSSLQQVKEVSTSLEEKLHVLKSEATFSENIQKMMRRTKVLIKAETANSNQQQSVISGRLEDLRKMLDNTEVSPDEVCPRISSLNEDLRRRCWYLDFDLDLALQESLAQLAPSESKVPGRPSCPLSPRLLQPSRKGVSLQSDPVLGIIHSLNRFGLKEDCAAESEQKGPTKAGPNPVQHRHRSTESVSKLSSFHSTLDSILSDAKDTTLQAAEDFYGLQLLYRPKLLPQSLDQWAKSMDQRLQGLRDDATMSLSTSNEEVVRQVSEMLHLLQSFPPALIGNHERMRVARLTEAAGAVRGSLEESEGSSEKEKNVNVQRLRVCVSEDKLQELDSREQIRQQQLQSTTMRLYQELQECVRAREVEFVTSLNCLTVRLLFLLDDLLTGDKAAVETHLVTISTQRTLRQQAVSEERDAAVKRFQRLVQAELTHSDIEKRRRLSKQQTWNTHWRQQMDTLRRTLKE